MPLPRPKLDPSLQAQVPNELACEKVYMLGSDKNGRAVVLVQVRGLFLLAAFLLLGPGLTGQWCSSMSMGGLTPPCCSVSGGQDGGACLSMSMGRADPLCCPGAWAAWSDPPFYFGMGTGHPPPSLSTAHPGTQA